jgi:NitT/TauT family transport system substrate-binding protein
MAVKIEKGGWILIFLVGIALVGFGLYRYGVLPIGKRPAPRAAGGGAASGQLDTSQPLTTASTGTKDVRIRVNIWVGCAAGLVANGGLETAPGSIFADEGLNVSFKIIDDWTEGAAALATNNVDVMLTTADVWAKDCSQLRDKGAPAHAFYMVDWSRGADGLIGKQGINSIEDLSGKVVAFAPYTPSHFLLWDGLKSSSLTTQQRDEIFSHAVHTKDGIEPATLFAQQKVDAAVAWDPDMSDAVAKRPGAKKVYDTKVASHLIADILVVSDEFAAKNPQTLVKLARGWLKGGQFIESNPARAYSLIGTIKDFNIPEDLAKTMLEGVRLADYGENLTFFGKPGSASDYDNIFRRAQEMYREERVIKHAADTEGSVDRRYLASLTSDFSTASSEPPTQYSPPKSGEQPIATQRRSIYFDVNSSALSVDSRAVVDEIGDMMRAYENTVVDIVGNTDATGPHELNVRLSRERAQMVKRYLMDKYHFPDERMRAIGNGPDQPVDTNDTPEGREKNRRTDIKVYPNPSH